MKSWPRHCVKLLDELCRAESQISDPGSDKMPFGFDDRRIEMTKRTMRAAL